MSASRDLGGDLWWALARVPVLPARVLQAAFDHGQATRNMELVRMVASRMDAPGDLVAQVAQVDDPSVMAQYAARPHLPGDVPVPHAVWTAAVVRDALTINADSASPQLLAAGLQVVASVPEYDALIGRLLNRCQPVRPLVALARWNVPVQDMACWCEAVLPFCQEQAAVMEWRAAGELATVLAAAWRGTSQNAGQVQDAGAAPAQDEDFAAFATGLVRTAAAFPTRARWFDVTPASQWWSGLGSSARWWAGAAVCDRPDVVASVVDQVVATPVDDDVRDTVAVAVLFNPLLTVADRHRVLDWVRARGRQPAWCAPDAVLDPVAMFPDDEYVRELWCQVAPDKVLVAHGWEPFGGRSRARAVLERLADQRGRSLDARDVEVLLGQLVAREDLDWLAGVLPPQLAGLSVCVPLALRFVADAVGQLSTEPGAWKVFTSLYPTFAGSAQELTATCATVLAP